MQYYDDFKEGQKIVTRGRTVTEADIVLFAAISGDWSPLHTNVEYVKNTPFGERIAHGMLVLTVASGLMPLYELAIVAFYGMDNVRFMAPTKIGDTLNVEAETVERQDKGDMGGVVSLKQSVKNQRGETVASMIVKVLIAKAPKK